MLYVANKDDKERNNLTSTMVASEVYDIAIAIDVRQLPEELKED